MILLANSLLTTQTSVITKTRCFPIEIAAKGLYPITVYNVVLDGINVNAFIKPYGKNLGAPLISDSKGQIKALLLFNIDYNENFLTNNNVNQSVLNRNKVLEFIDPNGNSSITYMPILQKPTG